jgi:hypothetical protein
MARLRLERILKFKKPPGDLLEIGTATDLFWTQLDRSALRVRGLDLSTTFAEIARKRHSLEIDVNYIEEASLPSSHYDVVWPAPGSEDTELGVLMEPEVGHGETEVYAGVQA